MILEPLPRKRGRPSLKVMERRRAVQKMSRVERESGMTADQLRDRQRQMREQFYASEARRQAK